MIKSLLTSLASKTFGDQDGLSTTDGIPGLVNRLYNLDGAHGTTLTSVVKKTLIGSTVYIEDSLINEEISVPLMGALNQLYTAYVIAALQIYESIDRYRTVSDSIGKVGTESFIVEALENTDPVAVINQMLTGGTEALSDKKFRNDIEEAVKHLAAGRMIEFDFNVTNVPELSKGGELGRTGVDKNRTVTVPLYVQLYPVGMPTEVAEAIIQLNYPEKFFRRLVKAYTREIRFFRDFILGMDAVAQHRKALKKDRNNVLNDFYNEKLLKQVRRVSDLLSGRVRNNIANSMVIVSAETFKKINDTSKIDLSNVADRQRFFNEAYAIALVVVDTDFNMIDFYYNGIPKKSELPFRAVKQAGSSKSGIDLEDVIRALATGNAPKF